MGLDVSHGAFSGAYSAFNRFRQAIAEAVGGSFPPHEDKSLDRDFWYWGNTANAAEWPGLKILLDHSDCDGEISPQECVLVASDLDKLLPQLQLMGEGSGHIANMGGYASAAKVFADGCRKAASRNEPLLFG